MHILSSKAMCLSPPLHLRDVLSLPVDTTLISKLQLHLGVFLDFTGSRFPDSCQYKDKSFMRRFSNVAAVKVYGTWGATVQWRGMYRLRRMFEKVLSVEWDAA